MLTETTTIRDAAILAAYGQFDSMRDIANRAVYDHQAVSAWRSVPMDKCPSDLLVYQEILQETQPAIIVETGAWFGGSALFFADMAELTGSADVLSVDLNIPVPAPQHPRLTFLADGSTNPATLARVHEWATDRRGFVILDSAHTREHVLAELDAYAPLVAVGCYLVVEDTNINGHPVRPDFGPGPWEAVHEWVPRHPEFVIDHDVEPFITFAPDGYLRRVA